jgi:hypothetical protein
MMERRPAEISEAAEPAESGLVSCRRRGWAWIVTHGPAQVTVAHSVGMQHLRVLLANPGHPIPAIDLVKGSGPARQMRESSDDGVVSLLSPQPLLDRAARQAYQVRLTQLAQDIDRWAATRPERAAQAQAERDWLIAELAAATGLGGRQRAFAGADERARIAVGKAIRRALDRIQAADPVIGDELRMTVQTGMRCCYQPL